MTTPATANCTFFIEDPQSYTEDEIVVSKGDTHHAVITHHYTGAVAFSVITTEEARKLYHECVNLNGEYFEMYDPNLGYEVSVRITG
tara:strand:- start:12751 stop:13011 length:261 start_codon:yes stop_codon:yes gene_type:complete